MIRPLILSLACLIAVPALAQTLPATSAAASQPTMRRSVVVPPGFVRQVVGQRIALCEPADAAWVKTAIQSIQPATRPSTMPSDIVDRLTERRGTLADMTTADLRVDRKSIDAMIDEKLLPALRQLDRVEPHLLFLVTTRPKLIELMKAGWEDPRFHYNRAANNVAFNLRLNLSLDREVDDSLLPALYDAGSDEAACREVVVRAVRDAEETIVESVAERGIVLAELRLLDFIDREAVRPLKLREDQQWLGLGLIGALGAKYGAEATGISRQQTIEVMTHEPRNIPVHAGHIDLLHPTPIADLRREYAPLYVDAMRRKSTEIVSAWLTKCGDAVAGKVLESIQKEPPADGAALVKRIHDLTGEDLSAQLRAR